VTLSRGDLGQHLVIRWEDVIVKMLTHRHRPATIAHTEHHQQQQQQQQQQNNGAIYLINIF